MRMAKKALSLILSLFIMINWATPSRVFAEDENKEEKTNVIKYVYITDSGVNIRLGPSTTSDILYIDGVNQFYTKGEYYSYLDEQKDDDDNIWYKLKYKDMETWVYGEYAEIKEYELDEEYDFEEELNKFPESYREALTALHNQHPNWVFKAYLTDIEWSVMIAAETVLGRSLIQSSNLNYRSKQAGAYNAETQQYIPLDGNSWFQASEQVVEYYIDPRNFINEEDIFMFLKLTYNECETAETVQNIIDGTFMQTTDALEGKFYHDIFVSAGQQANVSPIYLATLAIQEQGRNGSAAVSGTSFVLDGVTYSGLYNFFNIHATAGEDNWKKGLRYASTTNEEFDLPWTSPEKAIVGGAKWIADGYIADGQDTLYFQKFNSYNGVFWHQYQTNVQAAYSEAYTIFQAYRDSDALNSTITFTIPVYLNMPDGTYLPGNEPIEDPDPDPEEPQTNDFISALSLHKSEDILYGFIYTDTTEDIITKIGNVDSSLTVKFFNNEDEEITEESRLFTSMKMTVKDDEENETTYIISVKGDVNGDGKISSMDYVLIKNHIMNTDTLINNENINAADYNADGKISSMDYVTIKNIIMSVGG